MNPLTESRRSFIRRRLTQATQLGRSGDQTGRGRELKLIDMSLRPRWGLKGRGTLAYLEAAGAVLPSADNRAERQHDGSLLARLSPGEALILASLQNGGSTLAESIQCLPAEGLAGCYPVPRQDSHCWFIVAGPDAPPMFAKLCAVDLAPDCFVDASIAQTSLAKLPAIIIRHDFAASIAFSVLADSASAEYLWDCLIDAMSEFSGGVFESFGAAEQQWPGSPE
jgi:sarcosine oxidase, subunit gamma